LDVFAARARTVRGEDRAVEAAADGWLIGALRSRPRRRRLEEILIDRRLRDLDVSGLTAHIDRLEAQVAELTARLAPEERPPGHVLFFATPSGYEIVEADEPPPPVDQLLLLGDGCYRVHRTGRSPFPGDRRPCLFLEAEPLLT
jgi:hypothetical protein